jgi:hypothetical protein
MEKSGFRPWFVTVMVPDPPSQPQSPEWSVIAAAEMTRTEGLVRPTEL